MEITADIDLDEIADQVRENIEGGSFMDDIADRVRDDLNYGDIATEVIDSYAFENAVNEAVVDALEGHLDPDLLDTLGAVIKDLTVRIATLEAALAAAGLALGVPAGRALL